MAAVSPPMPPPITRMSNSRMLPPPGGVARCDQSVQLIESLAHDKRNRWMRLDHFDLNLLVAFDALLDERSVTRAARRLNVTQSAMSASLKRLRESLGDPVLLQHGKAMIPTPHALALAPEVSVALAALRRLTLPSTGFEPASSSRTFRVAASDYIATVVL